MIITKIILILIFTFIFGTKASAIECDLPLCLKIQKRSIESFQRSIFKEMENFHQIESIPAPKVYKSYKKVSFSKPVKKIKFLWPLKRGRISSNFGYRKSPFTGKRQYHSGLDIAAPFGKSIRAAASGYVTHSGWLSNGCGLGIIIKHSKYETAYCHTSQTFVKKGDKIKRGQRIGRVGSTGHSTGPHLHFEVRKNNKTYNPLKFLG